jgi:hypothetical protein
MENNSGFIKRNLSCNVCGGSDPAALNSNGSSYCFHCAKYYKKGENLKQEDHLNTADTIVDIQTFSTQKKETPIPLGECVQQIPRTIQ